MFDQLLKLMHDVGVQLSESPRASHQAWGRHLLEDWRSLELLAQGQPPAPETVESDGLNGPSDRPEAKENLVAESAQAG